MTDTAPSHEQLLVLVTAAARVADHGSLRPWRVIEVRGDARVRLGAAIAEASGEDGHHAEKLAAKPLRAPLLVAIVAARKPSSKIADWEQDAVAAGIGHTLSLLLHDAGWGVMWRTGHQTRTEPVRRMHGLDDNEQLLGWLYVGGIPDDAQAGVRTAVDPESFVSILD